MTNLAGQECRDSNDFSPMEGINRERVAMNSEPLTVEINSVALELGRLRQLFEKQANESPYLDVEAAARFLCVNETTVLYYAKRQRLLAYHVVGKNLVFHRDDLTKFMKQVRRSEVRTQKGVSR